MEFALICLPFFIILFAIIDFAEVFFYENSLQNALREAARFATAGRIIQTTNAGGTPAFVTNGGVIMPKAISDSQGREASRNACIKYWFMSNSVLHNLPLTNITIVSAPALPGVQPTLMTNGVGWIFLLQTNGLAAFQGPGNANDYVQISATYYVSTITPMMAYMGGYSGVGSKFPAHASAIVKNEPAILNFEHLAIYTNGDE